MKPFSEGEPGSLGILNASQKPLNIKKTGRYWKYPRMIEAHTLPETNVAPANLTRELIFQLLIFRGYVSLPEGTRG